MYEVVKPIDAKRNEQTIYTSQKWYQVQDALIQQYADRHSAQQSEFRTSSLSNASIAVNESNQEIAWFKFQNQYELYKSELDLYTADSNKIGDQMVSLVQLMGDMFEEIDENNFDLETLPGKREAQISLIEARFGDVLSQAQKDIVEIAQSQIESSLRKNNEAMVSLEK